MLVCRLYKENHSSLGCRGRNNQTRPPAEPPHNVLRGISRTGGECRFGGGDSGWKPGCRVLAVEREGGGGMRGCIVLILLLLAAPGMSSNHRGRHPGARRSEDARRQSAGVRRYNSSASPTEDVLGLVPLTGGRRAVLPFMHGRPFTASLTREALRAERRAAAERAVQGVLKVVFCLFLDQLAPRLPPRPSTNPTFTSFLTQTLIMLTKELLHLPDAPSLLVQ